jgi:nucleoside phosphorylase
MKQGDVIVSNGAIISDWRMEEGDQVKVSPYGVFDYRELNPSHLAKMVLECHDPLVVSLLERLPEGEFKKGHLLTSEAFVSGKDHKLGLGAAFNCLACDMESGAYAYVGNCLAKVPWLNVRVVADTLEDTLGDYFEKERNMTDILGQKIVKVLRIIDSLT